MNTATNPDETLRHQILADCARMQQLILRVANGDRAARHERDQLEAARQVKRLMLRSLAQSS